MVTVEWILVARQVTKAANLFGNTLSRRPSILLSRFEVLKYFVLACVLLVRFILHMVITSSVIPWCEYI